MANIPFLNNAYFAAKVGIGTDDPSRGVLQVNGDFETIASGNGQLAVISGVSGSDPTASDVGGQMVFGGPISATDSNRTFALVGGYKENGTSGNRAGYLSFGTRENTGARDIVERMRIDSTGNVGIGETSPDTALDVVGGNADSVVDTLTLKNDSTGNSAGVGINFVVDGVNDVVTAAVYGQRTGSAYHQGSLKFLTRDSLGGGLLERMRIASDGNVGMGYASPSDFTSVGADNLVVGPLSGNNGITVNSATTGYGALAFADGTGASDQYRGLIQYNHTTNSLALFTNASTKMTILSDGNVGIGVTGPSAKLHVYSTVEEVLRIDSGTTGAIHFFEGTTRRGILGYSNGTSIASGADAGDMVLRSEGPNKLHLSNGGTVALTVDVNENVGIGTTSPDSFNSEARNLVVNGSGNVGISIATTTTTGNSSVVFADGTGGTAGYRGRLKYGHATDYMAFFTAAAERMRILANGNVGIGTTNPGNRRLSVVKDTGITTGFNDIAEFLDTTLGSGGSVSVNFGRENSNKNIGKITFKYSSDGSSDNSLNLGFFGADNLVTLLADGNLGIGTASPSAKLDVAGTGNFTGLVSGITPVNAANFVTKAYVDGSGGGTGPFLPLAGGTMTGTNGVVFPDNFILNIGTANDLTIKHNATDSFIENHTGHLSVVNYSNDKDIIFWGDDGTGGIAKYLVIDGANEVNQFYKDASFYDGIRANFGNSNDLQIYHDGNNSYINETGTGSLVLKTGALLVRNPSDASMLDAQSGGAINLYYNGSKKFETTGTGVAVTGDINIDSALLSNQENTDVDTGTETVANVAVATYTAAFFDFVIKKTTNVRSGTVYACHDGTNVEFTETSTQDLGDTSDVTLSVDISGGDMRLRATTTSDDWSVKSLIRAI